MRGSSLATRLFLSATAWVVAMYQFTVTAPKPPASAAPRPDSIAPLSAGSSPD